jgi:hypothetical protein
MGTLWIYMVLLSWESGTYKWETKRQLFDRSSPPQFSLQKIPNSITFSLHHSLDS